MEKPFVRNLLSETTVGVKKIDLKHPPAGYRTDPELGLLLHDAITGQVVHTARDPQKGLYETRATITPGGDFLLLFPDGGHYGGSKQKKVNDMFSYRSSDRGKTWKGPDLAFDIEYNQHGFIPLTPRGSKRIYAFGTQPIVGMWDVERGLAENAPIGYRYSDDDGRTWGEVRIIRPQNDPGFRGMSVMRMCETEKGTWLIGAHEGDWSYKPLITRQYILRSEDRGATWTLLPNPRHGGWAVLEYGRMDEGRPIVVSKDEVLLMLRTPEGHLWASWSQDDGMTWSTPEPTSLVHPDAPPMLAHLSDGKTLIAFHHNRHSVHRKGYKGLGSNPEAFLNRSEIWFALSQDGGRTWSAPRFVLANAWAPNFNNAWRDFSCSYLDVFSDAGTLHLFMPHRWERALHLSFPESALNSMAAGF